jgi:hypothetical protein
MPDKHRLIVLQVQIPLRTGRDCVNPHQDLSWTRLRNGDINEFAKTRGSDLQGFHDGYLPFQAEWPCFMQMVNPLAD